MTQFDIDPIAPAACLVLSSRAVAGSMPNGDYKAVKDKITAKYKAHKARCDVFSANARSLCIAEADCAVGQQRCDTNDVFLKQARA